MHSYLEPLEPLLKGKTVIRSSMGKEVERAQQAIDLAKTHAVAIVSGGDAGVYGMASIVLEVLEHSGDMRSMSKLSRVSLQPMPLHRGSAPRSPVILP